MKTDINHHKTYVNLLPSLSNSSLSSLFFSLLGLSLKESSDPQVTLDQNVMGTEPIKFEDQDVQSPRGLVLLEGKFCKKRRIFFKKNGAARKEEAQRDKNNICRVEFSNIKKSPA